MDENSIYVPNMQNFGMWAFTSFIEIKYHIFLWSINNLLRWSFCKKKKWIKIGWKIKSNKFEMRGTFQIFLGQFYVRNGNNAFFCKGLRNSWKKSQKVSKCGDRIRIRMLHSYIIFYTYIGVLENLIEIIV